MPVPLANANIIEARFFCQDVEQASVNVLHYRIDNVAGGDVFASDVALALGTGLAVPYKNIIAVQATYRGVECRVVNVPKPLPAAYGSAFGAGPGLGTGGVLPRQTSGIITLRTELGGPFGRGRIYLPFPPVVANDPAGVPTVGHQNLMTAWGQAAIKVYTVNNVGNTGACTATPVLYHRDLKTYSQITNIVVRPVWATQKRRGSYGRGNLSPI